MTKRCARCGQPRLVTDFYRNRRWRDGFHPYCKKCLLSYQRERRLLKPSPTGRRWATSLGVKGRYFDAIDSPMKAYVLGLIAADGNVISNPRHHRVSLELAARDVELLELVRGEICPRVAIRSRKRRGRSYAVLALSSRSLRDGLVCRGVGPRKSLTLEWPKGVPLRMEPTFLLGYFDGDGWVTSVRSNGHVYPRWGILGTLAFVSHAREVIRRSVGVLCPPPSQKGKIWRLTKDGTGAVAIDRWLHNLSDLGLARKRVARAPVRTKP